MGKLVSILIPAYNADKWINEAIKSALDQTWKKKEVIIVDDGSRDRTLHIAKRFESKSVKVATQQNMGVCVARNKAFSLAQGSYIQWLDSDDILAKDKIEKQMACFEKYGDGVLASGRFGAFYYRIEKCIFKETHNWKDLKPIDWILTRFSENNWMTTESWLMSRKLCEKAGPWDERLILDEDGEYFCRLVSMSESIKFVPEAKSYYRVGNFGSQCRNRSKKALDSLLLSMELSFKILRLMEDSERTRNACLKFLHYRQRDYFPNNPEIKENAKKLARELGGILIRPDVGWKLSVAEKILGKSRAIMLNNTVRNIKTSVFKSIDKKIYEINRDKDNES